MPALKARPQLVAQLLWAGLHGVVSIEIRRHEGMLIPFEPIEDRVEAMCETVLAGLAVEKRPKPRSAPKASKAQKAKPAPRRTKA